MTRLAAPAKGDESPCALAGMVAYPPVWRVVAAALKVVSHGGLLAVLWLMVFSQNPPTNPLRQMRLFFGLFAAPEVAGWLLARALAARAGVQSGSLVLEQSDRRSEVPLDAIAAVEPWTVPLPRAGVSLRLGSGRRFDRGLAVGDADAFADALVTGGARSAIRSGLASPMAVYDRARRKVSRRIFEHPLLKFVVYSLVPAVPAFRLHQFIAYGGPFGEYYTFGLKAYLLGFGLWWVSFAYGLLCIAAGIRAAVEILALAASFAVPSYAVGVRRALEIVQRVLFYAGIPTWLYLRFTA